MVKITIISDTHGEHGEIDMDLLSGDIIIHCGDFVFNSYSNYDVTDFLDWFSKLDNFTHKVLIAGNHELQFEGEGNKLLMKYKDDVIYLEDDFVELCGLKIYGTPYQPNFRDWAFNLPREGDELRSKYALIPENTDVLITHNPPYKILDLVGTEHCGSKLLRDRVDEIKPKLHVFGHIHEDAGEYKTKHTHFINAAQMDRAYNLANKPISVVIE